MKTKTAILALCLSALFAAPAFAEARGYIARQTTVLRLSDTAETIVVARLKRVDNITLSEPGQDAASHKRVNDGKVQDGEAYIRREAVLEVREALKGTPGAELRVVSIRQLKFDNYDADLRQGDALYFVARRADGLNVILSDERGTVSAAESANDLNQVVDFTRDYLSRAAQNPAQRFAAILPRLYSSLSLDGSRLSQDAALELSWNHEDFAAHLTLDQQQGLVQKMNASTPNSPERFELITCMGRYKPEGAWQALWDMHLTDATFRTSSLCSWALEQIDRKAACKEYCDRFDLATDAGVKLLLIRGIGLIHPKDWHEGVETRQRALDAVKSQLRSDVGEAMLGEALIAARNLRTEHDFVETLKGLLDNRATNNLSEDMIQGCIVALASARVYAKGGDPKKVQTQYAVVARDYLNKLGAADAVLKQYVDAAIATPYTCLIKGADGIKR